MIPARGAASGVQCACTRRSPVRLFFNAEFADPPIPTQHALNHTPREGNASRNRPPFPIHGLAQCLTNFAILGHPAVRILGEFLRSRCGMVGADMMTISAFVRNIAVKCPVPKGQGQTPNVQRHKSPSPYSSPALAHGAKLGPGAWETTRLGCKFGL